MTECIICEQEWTGEAFTFRGHGVLVCRNCGFQWLRPQPTEEELSGIYSGQYFLDEANPEATKIVSELKRATAGLYLEQLVADGAPSNSQPSLLEIGCGMGEFLLEAKSKGFAVAGLEVTDYLVELANRRLGFPGVRKSHLEASSFEEESFDVVAFFDVLEHVRSPVEFMRRVNRLLRKSGRAYLVTPSLDSWSAKLLGKNWMEYKLEHLSYFSREAVVLLLAKTGFRNVRFHPNYKVLSLDYVNRHFVRFSVRGISPLVSLARRIVPDRVANMPIKVVASGLAVIAEKGEH